MKFELLLIALSCLLLAACQTKPAASAFTVESAVLSPEGRLALEYGAAPGLPGNLRSLPFSWHDLPAGTKALALSLVDKSFGDFVHWVATDFDPALGSLADNASHDFYEFSQGNNDVGRFGYYGPQPPGTNTYRLTLFALSAPTDLEPRFTLDELKAAMEGKILGQASLDMRYSAY